MLAQQVAERQRGLDRSDTSARDHDVPVPWTPWLGGRGLGAVSIGHPSHRARWSPLSSIAARRTAGDACSRSVTAGSRRGAWLDRGH